MDFFRKTGARISNFASELRKWRRIISVTARRRVGKTRHHVVTLLQSLLDRQRRVLAKVSEWLDEFVDRHPVATGFSVFILCAVLVLSIKYKWNPQDEYWGGVVVEATGMLFDILVFGVLIVWLDRRAENRQTRRLKDLEKQQLIKRYNEEIEDYLNVHSDEAKAVITARIYRLNKLGVAPESLSRANLEQARLEDANLERVNAYSTNFKNAQLHSANLRSAYLADANLIGADLGLADLTHAGLKDANLSLANLRRASIFNGILDGANLLGTKLNDANLELVHAIRINLTLAQLANANLNGAYLTNANLFFSNFKNANLVGVNFFKANFSGASLQEANFENAFLREAIFGKTSYVNIGLPEALLENFAYVPIDTSFSADLSGADFSGANLYGADLTGAINFSIEQLCKAKTLYGIKPDSLSDEIRKVRPDLLEKPVDQI